jgi:ketosteroid isomerase-like protein
MRTARIFQCLLAGILLSPPLLQAEAPADAAQAMVAAERKFYQTGQEKGTRAAFLAFLADDGIVFRPGPLNGKEVWAKRPETGFDLIWEPTFAVMARSGDFGFTTGPAKWRAKKEDEKILGYGNFVSIWKKQKDGSWKVALDLGIENPQPSGKPEALRTSIPDEAGKVDLEARGKVLKESQLQFTDAAKSDLTDAIIGAAGDEIRIYRDGSFPAIGKGNARTLIDAKKAKMSMESLGGDMSSTGDLAYTYGRYSIGDARVSGHYFQIWQTDKTGSWKLVVDWQQPLPKE